MRGVLRSTMNGLVCWRIDPPAAIHERNDIARGVAGKQANDGRGLCPRLKRATASMQMRHGQGAILAQRKYRGTPLPYPFTSEFPATHLRAR